MTCPHNLLQMYLLAPSKKHPIGLGKSSHTWKKPKLLVDITVTIACSLVFVLTKAKPSIPFGSTQFELSWGRCVLCQLFSTKKCWKKKEKKKTKTTPFLNLYSEFKTAKNYFSAVARSNSFKPELDLLSPFDNHLTTTASLQMSKWVGYDPLHCKRDCWWNSGAKEEFFPALWWENPCFMLWQTLFSQLFQLNAEKILALRWGNSWLAPEFHQSHL